MLVARSPMVFAYYSTLVLRAERGSLLFPIAVAEYGVFSLLSLFKSVFIARSVEYFPVFKGGTALAESINLLPLSEDVHIILADVGLCCVVQVSPFNINEAYLACHRSQKVQWVDKTYVGWYPFDSASVYVFDIPASVMTTRKRTVGDVPVKKNVGVVSVAYKPKYRKTLAEAGEAVSSVVDAFADHPDPASDVPIVEVEVVEEDSQWT